MSNIHSVEKPFHSRMNRKSAHRGFSLVEILVVVLILGILVGVVGSLMGGFITSFEVTDDQTIARRRAADVFNILHIPMLYAGMGIPASNFGYYFGETPIKTWQGIGQGPIQVIQDDSVMRVVYAVPAHVKTTESVEAFTRTDRQNPAPTSVPTASLDVIPANPSLTTVISQDVTKLRSYVTFPGIRMHPVAVTRIDPDIDFQRLIVTGKRSTVPQRGVNSPDVVEPNVIRAYHDMYLVRAGVAFVDNTTSTFYFADATSNDVGVFSGYTRNTAPDGFRVEGIKAVHFEPISRDVKLSDDLTPANHITGVRVYVIAEGDNVIAGRRSAGTPSMEFRNEDRWSGVASTLSPDVYYEEFQMQWRTRNVEAPIE